MPAPRLPARYHLIETFMLSRMSDSAHDCEHVYRVLFTALDIARHTGGADTEVLITSCLLHDVGRAEQYADSSVDHAAAGARIAQDWLTENDCGEPFSSAVARCITAHRFRSGTAPESIEAKILFDADKLDACGAMGVARTLLYKAAVNDPLYTLTGAGEVSDGAGDDAPSFFQEYKFKLETLYDKFYTVRAAELASERRAAAVGFYEALLTEARSCYAGEKFLMKDDL